jgi:hypothetical protein
MSDSLMPLHHNEMRVARYVVGTGDGLSPMRIKVEPTYERTAPSSRTC